MSHSYDPENDVEEFITFRATNDRSLRNRLVERNMGLGIYLAQKFSGRGISEEDLRQVALVGLVKAVDRFDPDRGVLFPAFASRTIEGELKRHFRDAGWAIRVPRSIQQLRAEVRDASNELTHRLSRSPQVCEIADELGVPQEDVIAALGADTALRTDSIDDAASDRLADTDQIYTGVENRDVVEKFVERLDPREAEIVRMRFYERLSQSEIADRIGLSQMHVSRLLRRSYASMRHTAAQDGELPSHQIM